MYTSGVITSITSEQVEVEVEDKRKVALEFERDYESNSYLYTGIRILTDSKIRRGWNWVVSKSKYLQTEVALWVDFLEYRKHD